MGDLTAAVLTPVRAKATRTDSVLPGSWFTLASFFVLVAPGALLTSLATRRRVRPTETTLQELARIVLASVSFSAVGLVVASLTARWVPNLLLSPEALALAEADDLRTTPGAAVGTVVVILLVSLGSVWVWNFFSKKSDATSLSHTSGWYQALREDLPASQYPFVQVELVGGTGYLGRVRSYSPDLEAESREIILSPPLMKADGNGKIVRLSEQWKRIVVAESQIVTLAVAYVRDDS